jgi:elongation factor P
MIAASDLKKGDAVKFNGDPCLVEAKTVNKPSARGAVTLYKYRLRNLRTGAKSDVTLRGEAMFEEADLERKPVQILYGDASSYTFMDSQDFSQFSLTMDELEGEWPYLTEASEGLIALLSDGRVIGLELPTTVALPIVETRPPMKGGSVTARTKPATLNTGLVVQVPEHLETGDVIRIDTRTGEYASKA